MERNVASNHHTCVSREMTIPLLGMFLGLLLMSLSSIVLVSSMSEQHLISSELRQTEQHLDTIQKFSSALDEQVRIAELKSAKVDQILSDCATARHSAGRK